jgi:hypothetical protein
MNNKVVTVERTDLILVAPRLQTICDKDGMPVILGRMLTPILPKLGDLTVIHPTTNDPCLVSSTMGTIAIWFKF